MRTVFSTVITALLLVVGSVPVEARGCVDGVRVFADVPNTHPLCVEIESLYRDGLTTGCRVDEDGLRYFCPNEPLTRTQGTMFAEHRDPFAQLDLTGRIWIGDHVVTAERFAKGHYWIQFSRDIQKCSREGWSHDYGGPNVEVRVRRLSPTIDTVEVFTTIHGVSRDMGFNVRLHCR